MGGDHLCYDPMKIALFTYGTLEIPEVMQLVAGQHFRSEPAQLKDHARYKLISASYPGVIHEAGSAVNGTLYFDLDETTLHKLDRYEDTCYTRAMVEVTMQTNEIIEAMAYIIEEDKKDLLSGNAWDKQEFIEQDLDVFIRTIDSRS